MKTSIPNYWIVAEDDSFLYLSGKLVQIDTEDLHIVSEFHWYLNGLTRWPEVRTKKNGKVYSLSRFILSPEATQIVDHINGNRLDNRKSNLRITDRFGNARNKRMQKNNKTGYKGVTKTKKGKYIAQIELSIEGKRKGINLGYFNSKEEAARTYDKAAMEYFGEFACLNFPKP